MANRQDFSAPVRTGLAHRAGYACSNPKCRAPTAGPSEESEDARSDVGVASHITAAAPGGPRYDYSLSESERAAIENGVWLCQTCAKKIDDDIATYSPDVLRDWKRDAETHASARLGRPSTSTIEQENRHDPLERMIAHRMRDAIAAATFPLAMLLPRSVGNDAAYPLSHLLSSPPAPEAGSEFPQSHIVDPLVDALVTPKLLEPIGMLAFAPQDALWIDWIVTGLLGCGLDCEKAIELYAGRGPGILMAQFEELLRHIKHSTEVMSHLAAREPDKLTQEVGRSLFAHTIKMLLKAQRTWLDFLASWQR